MEQTEVTLSLRGEEVVEVDAQVPHRAYGPDSDVPQLKTGGILITDRFIYLKKTLTYRL